eukprot:252248-Rhodomonas_salina.1
MAFDPLSDTVDGDALRQKAKDAAADAVKADEAGERSAAAARYEEASAALQELLDASESPNVVSLLVVCCEQSDIDSGLMRRDDTGLASTSDQQSLEGRIKEYRLRAEELKTAELATSIPPVPKPAAAAAAPPKPKDPPPKPRSAPDSDPISMGAEEQGGLYPDVGGTH